VPDATTLVSNVHPAKLAVLSLLLLDVMEEFCQALAKTGSPWAAEFTNALVSSRSQLAT
jgi:hypothetical protein